MSTILSRGEELTHCMRSFLNYKQHYWSDKYNVCWAFYRGNYEREDVDTGDTCVPFPRVHVNGPRVLCKFSVARECFSFAINILAITLRLVLISAVHLLTGVWMHMFVNCSCWRMACRSLGTNTFTHLNQHENLYKCDKLHTSFTPKQKCHFEEIFVTGCTGSCHFDNLRCSQWWRFRQNDISFQCKNWRYSQNKTNEGTTKDIYWRVYF